MRRSVVVLGLFLFAACSQEDATTRSVLEAERAENQRLANELKQARQESLDRQRRRVTGDPSSSVESSQAAPSPDESALIEEQESWTRASVSETASHQVADEEEIRNRTRLAEEERLRLRLTPQEPEPLVQKSESAPEPDPDDGS